LRGKVFEMMVSTQAAPHFPLDSRGAATFQYVLFRHILEQPSIQSVDLLMVPASVLPRITGILFSRWFLRKVIRMGRGKGTIWEGLDLPHDPGSAI
jgi:hypothetical protein